MRATLCPQTTFFFAPPCAKEVFPPLRLLVRRVPLCTLRSFGFAGCASVKKVSCVMRQNAAGAVCRRSHLCVKQTNTLRPPKKLRKRNLSSILSVFHSFCARFARRWRTNPRFPKVTQRKLSKWMVTFFGKKNRAVPSLVKSYSRLLK